MYNAARIVIFLREASSLQVLATPVFSTGLAPLQKRPSSRHSMQSTDKAATEACALFALVLFVPALAIRTPVILIRRKTGATFASQLRCRADGGSQQRSSSPCSPLHVAKVHLMCLQRHLPETPKTHSLG